MAKLITLALFAVLLTVLHMMPYEANGQETPSVSEGRSKFPPSGSIFGKRAYYGMGETKSISDGNTKNAAANDGASRSLDNFCRTEYHRQMTNLWTMSPNIWLYNYQTLKALCNY